MRRALHLGVQKALGVVGSHYQVNFEAVASGYVVSEGVEDEVVILVSLVALFHFYFFLGEFGLGKFDFVSGPLGRRQERRAISLRRRRLSLARTSFPLGHSRPA
jgi:hypothetical protein